MSLTFTTWRAAVTTMMATTTADPNYVVIEPDIIDSAEQRIYRETDLLANIVRDSSGALTVGTRTFTLPQSLGRFVVVNGINVITPVTQTNPDLGTRNRMTPASTDAVEAFWPSTAGAGVPQIYGMITDQTLIVGPAPGAAYTMEVTGTIRPTPLSSTNATTFLTLFLPDLFLAASMIFASGYQKNFGSQSDDPRMAVSWQAQYDKLLESTNTEEVSKKFEASAWSSLRPSPLAQPPRN